MPVSPSNICRIWWKELLITLDRQLWSHYGNMVLDYRSASDYAMRDDCEEIARCFVLGLESVPAQKRGSATATDGY